VGYKYHILLNRLSGRNRDYFSKTCNKQFYLKIHTQQEMYLQPP
jgi:hypothetical protein